jgi:hypothetical protein
MRVTPSRSRQSTVVSVEPSSTTSGKIPGFGLPEPLYGLFGIIRRYDYADSTVRPDAAKCQIENGSKGI